MTNKTIPKQMQAQPSEQLLRQVRAGFIAQGTTFTEYCRAHNIHAPNARTALRGGWRGPKASKLINRLVTAAQVSTT